MVALLGRNGTGKTTLMKYIMGLVVVQSGSVEMNGRVLPLSLLAGRERSRLRAAGSPGLSSPDRAREHHRGGGCLPTGPELCRPAGVRHVSHSGGSPQHPGRQPQRRPAADTHHRPGAGHRAETASARRTDRGAQPAIVDEIEQILRRLNREQGIAVLLAEQNFDFAASVTSRAYIMDKGRIAYSTSRDDLVADKRTLHELLGV